MKLLSRQHAGLLLSERVVAIALRDPLVLALPRGGVPVGLEIAKAIGAPLEALVVRKVGAPGFEEFGIGAITEDNHYWIDPESVRYAGAHAMDVERILAREREEVKRRIKAYRGDRPLPNVRDRSVVVADDGLATGVTARVACAFLRQLGASEVILAVPVCSPRMAALVRKEVDQLICLEETEHFQAVGQFYEKFPQLTDSEVVELLNEKREEENAVLNCQEISITEEAIDLSGTLAIPPNHKGVVIFAHGSGSSRFSPRNQSVARALQAAGFGTLLFDLLTPDEANDRRNVFDIPLLGKRLLVATQWLRDDGDAGHCPLGYFGSSTGGGACLWAAAEPGNRISAIVSRGGRPDLAWPRLREVTAPTLLLVGGRDEPVIELNQLAMVELRNAKLTLIPGASHLFEENGTMELVERETTAWFLRHFSNSARRAA